MPDSLMSTKANEVSTTVVFPEYGKSFEELMQEALQQLLKKDKQLSANEQIRW